MLGAASGEIASLDVADEVEARDLKKLVRFLRDGIPLLRLLTDAQQPDGGIGTSEHALDVGGAEAGELHELLGIAVDVRTRIEDGDGLAGRRKERHDRRP